MQHNNGKRTNTSKGNRNSNTALQRSILNLLVFGHKRGMRIFQGVPQAAVQSRHQEEEKTNITKHAQIEQKYKKH